LSEKLLAEMEIHKTESRKLVGPTGAPYAVQHLDTPMQLKVQATTDWSSREQGCQIFLATNYQNG
jgi:hypothetical protein